MKTVGIDLHIATVSRTIAIKSSMETFNTKYFFIGTVIKLLHGFPLLFWLDTPKTFQYSTLFLINFLSIIYFILLDIDTNKANIFLIHFSSLQQAKQKALSLISSLT